MRRQRYSSDLSRAQFTRLEPLLPGCKPGGRHQMVELREVMGAILYVLQNGCTWRNLSHGVPAWKTVYGCFRRFEGGSTWEAVNRVLVRRTRRQADRNPEPSAGRIDSQTVRCAPQAGLRGVDADKQTNGRTRHVVVETLDILPNRCPRLKHLWADGGYTGELVTWASTVLNWVVEIVHGRSGQRGFVVFPRRRVVERSLA